MNFAKKEKNCRALPLDLLAKNCTKSRSPICVAGHLIILVIGFRFEIFKGLRLFASNQTDER